MFKTLKAIIALLFAVPFQANQGATRPKEWPHKSAKIGHSFPSSTLIPDEIKSPEEA